MLNWGGREFADGRDWYYAGQLKQEQELDAQAAVLIRGKMTKGKRFDRTRFPPEVLARAREKLGSILEGKKIPFLRETRRVSFADGETWHHDSDDEFYSDLRRPHASAKFHVYSEHYGFEVTFHLNRTEVDVEAPSREEISSLFEIFEEAAPGCRLPEPEKPDEEPPRARIFIGHGRSDQWRDLKDHLHEQHGYEVEAYEIGARAGHTIRDILQQMLRRSNFALLVLTGEDETQDGRLRARPNVIHELGLFQGRLGFARAVALVEAGTDDFSNLQGVHQIRYGKGNIKETFGEILATLRREFEANRAL